MDLSVCDLQRLIVLLSLLTLHYVVYFMFIFNRNQFDTQLTKTNNFASAYIGSVEIRPFAVHNVNLSKQMKLLSCIELLEFVKILTFKKVGVQYFKLHK